MTTSIGSRARVIVLVLVWLLLAAATSSCTSSPDAVSTSSAGGPTTSVAPAAGGAAVPATTSASALPPLPDSAYYAAPGLPVWNDPETGYDTTRRWTLEGGVWPVMLVMSPSQSPQAIVGTQMGMYEKALAPFNISPRLEKLDGPPRVFHALERSQWPFVYMPLAVFMDYSRSRDNQGGAGGLQYVALAGSTAGGGYTLMARDEITSLADLKGKTVGLMNMHPVPGTLLEAAAKKAGLSVGDGPDDIHYALGDGADQLNRYMKGEYDAVVSFNIYKKQLADSGSHPVTDFSEVGYRPNYTILAVERTVLEQRPDVVKAFLEAHYAAGKTALDSWDPATIEALFQSWNDFFGGEKTAYAKQRLVPDVAAYRTMLGDMWVEPRLDPAFLKDAFAFNSANDTWGWDGTVDTAKLMDLDAFNTVLAGHGEPPQ